MRFKKLQLMVLFFAILLAAIFVLVKKILFNEVLTNIKNNNITQKINSEKLKPYPKKQENILDIQAAAAFSIFIGKNKEEYLLFEKNKEVRFPIASITKLMVALIASEIYKENDEVIISKSALGVKGLSGNYILGDKILFKDAIRALLISSHNEIAVAIAERVGIDEFLRKMNDKAVELGLVNTHYFNVSGVDPSGEREEINYSTASDTYKLIRHIFENYPDIFSILREKEYYLKDAQGNLKTIIKTTNKLLEDEDTALSVFGGKTGSTPRAKFNLAIVSEAPSDGYIISVVIGSENSFQDMKNLLKYVKESFVW